MSTTSPPTDAPPQKPSTSRMPSLNALAARINSSTAAQGNTAPPANAAPRPRLAASALRTASAASVATTDSTAVNAPTSRSDSPASIAISPPHSTRGSVDLTASGDSLTAEKLEKLDLENNEASPAPEKKRKVGYKNIPSLDAITARLAKTRQLSIDGTANPPEPPMIEDPKTPGFPMKAPEHPLQYTWTFYHDSKTKFPFTPGPAPPPSAVTEGPNGPYSAIPPDTGTYEAGLTVIGECDTVESFCRYFNWLKPPSKLEKNSNYHLFKSGIKPMWEDEANANGGKWVLTMKNNPVLLDRSWSWLAMALVGEELEEGRDEICGAVVSLRSKVDRIQVWTRGKDDVERLNAIGKKLVKLLDISEADGIGLEFQFNTEDRPLPNKFLNISALPATSFRPTFPGHVRSGSVNTPTLQSSDGLLMPGGPVPIPNSAGPAPGGAFGSFGLGIGTQGPSPWRGGAKK